MSLTDESDRSMSIREVIGGRPRSGGRAGRRGAGLAAAALVGAAVVLSGGWALQDVLLPPQSTDPERSLWLNTAPGDRTTTTARRDVAPAADRRRRRGRDDGRRSTTTSAPNARALSSVSATLST